MLEIKNLTVNYGPQKVLNEVTLSVAKGDSLALIGESGTGKTTLGMSIIGLGTGSCSGEILYQDRNLIQLSPGEMAGIRWNEIAMVFQDVEGAFNPLYTILDQVTEPIVTHGLMNKEDARKKAEGLLRKAGLAENLFARYPHELSSGQKQRALIAMGLSNDPEILILDEPTSALDPLTKAEIIDLLEEVSKSCTMLVITHDIATAARLCAKTAVLYGGKIVELGPTEKVIPRPKHPYTRGLLRCYPNMTTTKDLQGIPGKISWPEKGCPYEPRCTQKVEVCKESFSQPVENDGRLVACHLGGIVPLLRGENLAKNFGAVKALDGVSLTLFEGETVSIVGESGSGKTTLAKAIMGLHELSEGTVYLESKPVSKRDKDFYQKVQMIFQNPKESISPRMNVLEAVSEPLDVHKKGNGEDKATLVKKLLGEVELPATDEFLQAHPFQLSSGEAQRVAIARALVLEPKLLIADEPTSALDPSVQAKIVKLLLNLQEKRGLSIIFITHDIALARKISDRIVVLKEGRIVEEGPANMVTACPQNAYTQKLLAAAPALEQQGG